MSVFQNFFDQFDAYVEAFLPNSLGVITSEHFDTSLNDLDAIHQALADTLTFDPFNWVLGIYDGNMDFMNTGVPIDSAIAESIPVSLDNFDVGSYGDPGVSPADHWLTGNEWGGSISSGTIDVTGQGNDVFAVDGEVISLPT